MRKSKAKRSARSRERVSRRSVKQNKNKKVVVLLGDSILDNAYWNDVGKDTTAVVLRKRGIDVIDRSTDEVTSSRLLKALNNKSGIIVKKKFVKFRQDKGIPYEGKMKSNEFNVYPIPETDSRWWETPISQRYVVLSIGGNDFALEYIINIDSIINRIKKNIKQIITKLKVEPSHVAYLIPYSPDRIMKSNFQPYLPIPFKEFYQNMVTKVSKMCESLDIKCISLSGFTNKDRLSEEKIAEPTKKGAAKIARKISSWIKS